MTVFAALAAPTGLLRGNALTDAVPQVAGVILATFLLLAVGIVIAAYAEATARRIKPRIVLTQERRGNEIGNAAGAVFLLALLVAVAMLMDHGF